MQVFAWVPFNIRNLKRGGAFELRRTLGHCGQGRTESSGKTLSEQNGLIRGRRIAIRKNLTTQTEKSCVLAEELGHYFTSHGNILDMDEVKNRKQELRARLYGYDMQIGLIGIIECYKHHCRSLYEMAEYLQVTEEYLKEALSATVENTEKTLSQ